MIRRIDVATFWLLQLPTCLNLGLEVCLALELGGMDGVRVDTALSVLA